MADSATDGGDRPQKKHVASHSGRKAEKKKAKANKQVNSCIRSRREEYEKCEPNITSETLLQNFT